MSLEPDQDDLVWVQDYHLMLLPRFLRERMPSLSIGWFLHTPFCTSEMYRTLGHREEILRGVLSADLRRSTLRSEGRGEGMGMEMGMGMGMGMGAAGWPAATGLGCSSAPRPPQGRRSRRRPLSSHPGMSCGLRIGSLTTALRTTEQVRLPHLRLRTALPHVMRARARHRRRGRSH